MSFPLSRPARNFVLAVLALIFFSLSDCKGMGSETQTQPSTEMFFTETPAPPVTPEKLPNLKIGTLQILDQKSYECNEKGKVEVLVSVEIVNDGDAEAGFFHVNLNEEREELIPGLCKDERVVLEISTTTTRFQVMVDHQHEVAELEEGDNFGEVEIPQSLEEACSTAPDMVPVSDEHLLPHYPENVEIRILQIRMFSEIQGWAIGDQEDGLEHVLYTRDGGQTWHDVSPPEGIMNIESPFLKATAFFLDLENAWVTYQSDSHGQHGVVWRTQNAGHTWEQSTFLIETIKDSAISWAKLEFVDDKHGWLLIDHCFGGSTYETELFQTKDGGITWLQIQNDQANRWIEGSIAGIDFIDSENGMISSTNFAARKLYTYFTRNGGKTWNRYELSSPDTNSDLFNLLPCGIGSPVLLSAAEGLLNIFCYNDDGITASYLYGTLDAGYTWKAYPLPDAFRGVSNEVVKEDLIYLLGTFLPDTSGDTPVETSRLYESKDRGKSWNRLTTVHWYGRIHFIDENMGWAITRPDFGGLLFSTSDGGLTWERVHPKIATADGSETHGG